MNNSDHQHADGIQEGITTPPPVYFNVLLSGLVIWAVLFCGYYLFSGWSSTGEFQEKMALHQQIGQVGQSGQAGTDQ